MKSYRIRKNINQKYDNQFNFFQVKPINEILYERNFKASTLQFKDISVLIDLNEFLKRYYYLKNSAGRNEIVQRVRMLTQFYQQNLMMRFEYPTMVVTNTKAIFLRRIRRLKKMEAGQDSSDISEQQQKSQPLQFSSSILIKTIPSDVSKQEYCRRSKQNQYFQDLKSEQSYSVYDIYQMSEDQPNLNANNFDKNKYETEISHLICDFNDMDIQEALQNYKKAEIKIGLKDRNEIYDKQKQECVKKVGANASKIIITPLDYVPHMKNSNLKNESPREPTSRQNIIRKNSPINSYEIERRQYKPVLSPKTNRGVVNGNHGSNRQQQTSYISFIRNKQRKQESPKNNAYRAINQKWKDQTYATRNQTHSRYIQNLRDQHYAGQSWNIQQMGFDTAKSYHRPAINSPSQDFHKFEQIKSFQFKKESPSRKYELRNIKTIKEKAIALLSGVKNHQSPNFQDRY